MPIHAYHCEQCEKEYEIFYRKMSDVETEEPEEKCPTCGSTKKRRLPPTGTTYQNKGGGFHAAFPSKTRK